MQSNIQESDDLKKTSALKKKEEEKMRDVLLLLESLSHREENSIKLIIDCLYDIGSINLIDQKFRSRTLKGSLKWIARLTKPAFRIIAWRWYKKNCPQLIANWLRTKVLFQAPAKKVKQEAKLETQLVPKTQTLKTDSLVQLENHTREVRYLQSQVRMLASILACLIVLFGGSVVWFGYSLGRYNLQTREKLQNRIKIIETNTDKPLAKSKDN